MLFSTVSFDVIVMNMDVFCPRGMLVTPPVQVHETSVDIRYLYILDHDIIDTLEDEGMLSL